VSIDPIGDLVPVPAVGSNNWSGAVAATRHLFDLGHRRIGVITGPVKALSSRARLDGFRATLDHAGIPLDASLERHGVFTFDDGCQLGLELLGLPEPPTALVCGDDLQAMGVYEAARQTGLRIPADLSVVGFDDIDQASWLAPPLTTVRQPFAEMGATAARLALTLADGGTLDQDRYELGTALVVRGSTAPPRSW
jgi:LacI family xylobiose transport system transcriptional regulator